MDVLLPITLLSIKAQASVIMEARVGRPAMTTTKAAETPFEVFYPAYIQLTTHIQLLIVYSIQVMTIKFTILLQQCY